MHHDELTALTGRLLWSTPASRREFAEEAVQSGPAVSLELLARTVRSQDTWRLRARSLEVLGLMAGQADRQLAERILALLLEEEA